MLKNRETYEIMTPEAIGLNRASDDPGAGGFWIVVLMRLPPQPFVPSQLMWPTIICMVMS